MADDPYNPDYEYLAYFDEAGETGLRNVLGATSTGSSEWFMLSVVLIRKSEIANVDEWITEMLSFGRAKQLRDIHFAKLPDAHKRHVSGVLAHKQNRAMCFVICSNKKNMLRYNNARVATMGVNDWFYCWLTRLALERVSNFVWRRSMQEHNSPRRMRLIFSERSGLRIGQIGAYYQWIKQQSLNDNLWIPWGDLEWETLHPLLIDKDFHRNLAGLKLADIVASAFYAAADNKQSGPCQPEYAMQLKPVMARYKNNASGRYAGYGVKLLPTWNAARLSDDQKVIFEHYNYPGQLWQEGKRWELPPPK
jgi:hypothetical protein